MYQNRSPNTNMKHRLDTIMNDGVKIMTKEKYLKNPWAKLSIPY
jgi:hypothetical protein